MNSMKSRSSGALRINFDLCLPFRASGCFISRVKIAQNFQTYLTYHGYVNKILHSISQNTRYS